jgi:hypothetical protein
MHRYGIAAAATLTTLIILLGARPAWGAGEIQLAWGDCRPNGGKSKATFACDTNEGGHRLVVSFTMPQDFPGFLAVDGAIDLWFEGGQVPEWWQLRNSGVCRENALGLSVDIGVLPGGGAGCADTWGGGAQVEFSYTGYGTFWGGNPDRARAVFGILRPAADPMDLMAGVTYFGWTWTLSNERTIGPDACGGCLLYSSIYVSSIIPSSAESHVVLQGYRPFDGDPYPPHAVDWQTHGPIVPTARTTWGAVKAMYH